MTPCAAPTRRYEEPTRQAVLQFQHTAGASQTGNIWPDDWARLLS